MTYLVLAVLAVLLAGLCLIWTPEKPARQVEAEEYGRQVKGGG